MSKYRIVQYNNGKYALQKYSKFLLFTTSVEHFHVGSETFFSGESTGQLYCLYDDMVELKKFKEGFEKKETEEKLAKSNKVAKVIEDSKLEKVLK